jgi:hypothetical protein
VRSRALNHRPQPTMATWTSSVPEIACSKFWRLWDDSAADIYSPFPASKRCLIMLAKSIVIRAQHLRESVALYRRKFIAPGLPRTANPGNPRRGFYVSMS